LKQLPVIATVKEAIQLVWRRRFVVFRALIGTSLVLAAIDVVKIHFMQTLGWFGWLVLDLVIYSFVFTLFAVTCHRLVLLGDASVPRYGLHSWTSRETRFLGWLAVIALYVLLVVVALGLIGVGAAYSTDKELHKYVIPPFVVAAGILAAYLFARIAVLLPAAAIGERHDTDWAFNTTAKNAWRLIAAVVLIPAVPGLALYALPLEHTLLTDFLLRLVYYAFAAIGIAVLSLSFRFLASADPDEPRAGTSL